MEWWWYLAEQVVEKFWLERWQRQRQEVMVNPRGAAPKSVRIWLALVDIRSSKDCNFERIAM